MTAAAIFPVVFFDGDRDVDAGTVAVTEALDFEKFRAIVSRTIGIPPQQISISLIRRRRARFSPEIRRKEPIDERTDFSAIAKERDCFVLVVMRRRSRRGRGKSGKKSTVEIERKTILTRNGAIPIGIWDYELNRRMREGYLMMSAMSCPPLPPPPPPPPLPECSECVAAAREGRSPGFHMCVYDEVVVVGFRSTAGPIERPAKKHVKEASA